MKYDKQCIQFQWFGEKLIEKYEYKNLYLYFCTIWIQKYDSYISTCSRFSFPLMQIEPESQTRLLDATMNMEGVLLAGVPGAGGFHAVFAISKAWSSQGVLPLLVREDPHGVSLESSDPKTNELTSSISSVKVN